MARTKAKMEQLGKKQRTDLERGIKRYNELATVAHCMDNHLREKNQRLEIRCNILISNLKYVAKNLKTLQEEHNQLQLAYSDLANTMATVGEENEELRRINRRLTEQLLDQNESDPEWEANIDYFAERDRLYRDE